MLQLPLSSETGARLLARAVLQVRAAAFEDDQHPRDGKGQFVTLYRVESKDLGDKGEWLKNHMTPKEFETFKSERGRYFSEQPLEQYGHGAAHTVTYTVTVPKDVADKARRWHPDGYNEYVVPKEYVDKKKVYMDGGKKTRELAGFDEGQHPRDHKGQFASGPMAGETTGQHTPEAQRRVIEYLQQETGEQFRGHGSVSKGETSSNDMDLVRVDPTASMSEKDREAYFQKQTDEANQAESDLHDQLARGEITHDEAMQKLYGGSPDKTVEALAKIGFVPTKSMEFGGALVTRFENAKTQHTIEIWEKGDDGHSDSGPVMRSRDLSAAFDEGQHPRDGKGQFSSGGSSISPEEAKLLDQWDEGWVSNAERYEHLKNPRMSEGKEFNRILEKLPSHTGVAYRATHMTPEEFNKLRDTSVYTNKLNNSASKSRKTAEEFIPENLGSEIPGRVSVLLELKGYGHGGLKDISAHTGKNYGDQQEVIMRAGSKWDRVNAAEKVGPYWKVTLWEHHTNRDKFRSAAATPTTLRLADEHLAKFTVAVRYAFAKGRATVQRPAVLTEASLRRAFAGAPSAVRAALGAVLPGVLGDLAGAAGAAALEALRPARRGAAFEEDQHPRDGKGQFSASGVVPGHIGVGGVKVPDRDDLLTPDVINELFTTAGLPAEARTEEGATRLFQDGVRGKTLYHEAPGDVSQSIRDHGLTGGGDWQETNFACVGVPSNYIQDDTKTIVAFTANPTSVRPDPSYAWSEKLTGEQMALLQFPKLTGAYVAVTTNIPSHRILSITVQKSGKTIKTLELRAAKSDESIKITTSFDASDPLAVAWAKEHAAELAKDLSETTEQDIQDALAAAFEDTDFESVFDDVLDAVGDEARAAMIARTETMRASNMGQRLGWEKAQEDGLLDETARRVWITTPGCCDECEDMDEEEAPIDGDYPGGEDGPPLHPNCRCTEGVQ